MALLRKTTDESKSDPINHFALLSEIVYAASVFGVVEEGWTACDEMVAGYRVEELPHIEFIRQLKSHLNQDSALALYGRGVAMVDGLIDEDRFEEAQDVAKSLSVSLRQLASAKSEIDSLAGRAKLLDRKFKQIQDDLKVLDSDASNEKANGNVGEFYCLQKSDFEKGLPYLAKGPAGAIRDLANEELSLKNATPRERLGIANRWWDLGEDKKLAGMKALAIEHYLGIVDGLQGLDKIKVEGRIKDDSVQFETSGDIAKQLSNFDWRVDWDGGRVWKQIRLTESHLSILSDTDRTYNYSFNVRDRRTVEVWNADKTDLYTISLSGGNLVCVKFTPKSGTKLTGVGIKAQQSK